MEHRIVCSDRTNSLFSSLASGFAATITTAVVFFVFCDEDRGCNTRYSCLKRLLLATSNLRKESDEARAVWSGSTERVLREHAQKEASTSPQKRVYHHAKRLLAPHFQSAINPHKRAKDDASMRPSGVPFLREAKKRSSVRIGAFSLEALHLRGSFLPCVRSCNEGTHDRRAAKQANRVCEHTLGPRERRARHGRLGREGWILRLDRA